MKRKLIKKKNPPILGTLYFCNFLLEGLSNVLKNKEMKLDYDILNTKNKLRQFNVDKKLI